MQILRHTLYNFAGSTAPIVVTLATVPLYLSAIGLERYGLLSICWLLLGYFGLFDLGLGRATTHRLASLRTAPADARSRVFWSSIGLTLLLGLAACLLFVPLAAVGLGAIKLTTPALGGELWRALPWLAACLPLAMLNGVLTGSLSARDRFLDLNLINALGTVLMSVLPLATAWLLGPRLDLLIAASLLARACSAILLFARCATAIPLERPRLSTRADIMSLARYGGWVTIIGATEPILTLWDRFAVGAVLGASAVAYYVVPFNLVIQARILPASLAGAMFPKLSGGTADEIGASSREAMRMLSAVLTPVVLIAALVIGPFLDLWVGPAVAAKSAPVAYLLLPGIWAHSLAHVPGTAILAQGRPARAARLFLAELVPYAALLYLCMTLLGLPGVALAWSIRCTVDAMLLFVLSGEPARRLAPLALPFALVCGAVAVCLTTAQPLLGLVPIALAGSVYALRTLLPAIAQHRFTLLKSGVSAAPK